MAVRGVRGAITVDANDADQIRAAAKELMEEILRRNAIDDFDDVISAVFTTTVKFSSLNSSGFGVGHSGIIGRLGQALSDGGVGKTPYRSSVA